MMTRQMVIYTIDHTDHTLIFKFTYGNILELKSKLKLSNMYAYGKLISLQWQQSGLFSFMYSYLISSILFSFRLFAWG